MTDDELAAIEARANAATSGPWTWEDWQTTDDPTAGPNPDTLTAPSETRENFASSMFPDLRNGLITDENRDMSPANRAFIAHARADVPALVAKVRRLREQVRIAEDVLNHIARCGCAACGPAPRDLAHARTLADDALTRMDAVEYDAPP